MKIRCLINKHLWLTYRFANKRFCAHCGKEQNFTDGRWFLVKKGH